MIINQNEKGGTIIYNADDFIGLVPGYAAGNFPRVGRGASWLAGINPWREAPGVLAPSFPVTALDNSGAYASSVIRNAVVDRSGSNPNAWLIEDGAAGIHQLAGSAGVVGKVLSVTAPFPFGLVSASGGIHSTAAHGSYDGEDIAEFNISGTNYIFYSFNDDTDGDLGRVITNPTSTGDFDNDWYSAQSGETPFTLGVPHPILEGDDNRLYTGDDVNLRVVSNAGAFSSTSSVVPAGFMVKCFGKTGEQFLIGAERKKGAFTSPTARGEAVVQFWDYGSQSSITTKQLNDNEVTALIYWKGTVWAFTQGRPSEEANIGKRSKLQKLEGGEFVPKFYFSESSPTFGGIEIHDNLLVWNSDGVIYSYGSPYPDFPDRVNKIGVGSGATSGGYAKSLNGTDLYISTGAGTSCEYLTQGTTYESASQWRGLVAEPIAPPRHRCKVKDAEICFYGSASGGRTIQFTLIVDDGATVEGISSILVDGLGTVTAGTQLISRAVTTGNRELPYFSSIKPLIAYSAGSGATSAPKISYIKINYEFREISY